MSAIRVKEAIALFRSSLHLASTDLPEDIVAGEASLDGSASAASTMSVTNDSLSPSMTSVVLK